MRVELESTQMTLNEFVDCVLASDEPVELVRDEEVVVAANKSGATVLKSRKKKKSGSDPESKNESMAYCKKFWVEAKANVAKNGGAMPEREAEEKALEIVDEVRRKSAARSR